MHDSAQHSVTDVLLEIEAFGRQHDPVETDRTRRMLNLERPTAELIDILVRSSRRKRVLEIGTSNGYSTLWLARALRDNAGQPLVTLERDPAKFNIAAENIARAGLGVWAQQLLGDASELVGTLPGTFDCVFFDADRVSAAGQLTTLLPKLEPDVLLFTDNVLSHPEEVAPFLALCRSLPGFKDVVVPVGKGLHIAYRPAEIVVNSWNQHPR